MQEIVDLLEIEHLLKKRPYQLSGGEKQRISLGRTLLASPRFLLLDEPLAALDQSLKEQILSFLKRVKDELEIPMIYISHSMDEILHLTDQLVVINNGHIIGTGHFMDVLGENGTQDFTSMMGLENIFRATIISNDLASGLTIANLFGNRIFLPLSKKYVIGKQSYISVRSSEIAIAKQHIEHISIQNQIKGKIFHFIPNDTGITVYIDIGGPLIVNITRKAFVDLELRENDEVHCLIKVQSFSCFGKILDR